MNILVTGGAGFIGCNLTSRLIRDGHDVVVFDNLSRPGTRHNIAWLEAQGVFTLREQDITDSSALASVFRDHEFSTVIHLAGQVAVTTSVADPRSDFNSNALGTFNVLEATRQSGQNCTFLYSSTNKVYGGMEQIAIVEKEGRYCYDSYPSGIPEEAPLDFHSPYGCSKGAGDQYVRDYARIYGMRTVVFRQSCIYGPHQMGVEDQGWLAWFAIAVLSGNPITIYGDGRQVRDVLYVDDLIEAYLAAIERIDDVAGQVFNIGGGPENTLAIWAGYGPMLEKQLDRTIPVEFDDWRPGDQRVFISNIEKAGRLLGWQPKYGPEHGVPLMVDWIVDNKELFVNNSLHTGDSGT
jgi:CDP-paratose 2-epimerase